MAPAGSMLMLEDKCYFKDSSHWLDKHRIYLSRTTVAPIKANQSVFSDVHEFQVLFFSVPKYSHSIQAKRLDEYVLKQHGSLFSFLRHDPLVHICRPCCMRNHTTPTNKIPRSPNNTSASINNTDMIGSTTYWPRFQRGNPAVSNRLFSWVNKPPSCPFGFCWSCVPYVHCCCCDCPCCLSCLLPRFLYSWARGSLSATISPFIIVTITAFLVFLRNSQWQKSKMATKQRKTGTKDSRFDVMYWGNEVSLVGHHRNPKLTQPAALLIRWTKRCTFIATYWTVGFPLVRDIESPPKSSFFKKY